MFALETPNNPHVLYTDGMLGLIENTQRNKGKNGK